MDGAPVKPGDILAGKYQVERVLGIGGMGMVVAATHLELLEPRALKFIIPSAFSDVDAAPRFLREARAAAKLKSEYIAKVYDVGRLDSGAPYMVMEYLEGSDLDALLKKHGPLAPSIAALYALQVCSALAEAHAAGIIHRDLKPANLFLTRRPDGSSCVRVLDFGISKVITPGAELDVTKTQQLLGSPLYMSPEQMRSTRSVDTRSDIWSLGVILYKLITGKVPFAAQNITELVAMVLEVSPMPPSQLNPALPPGFDAVILRCLRRSRDERYASVVELAADLARFAPPDAAALVDAMARVFAAAAPIQRDGSASVVVADPNRSGTPLAQNAPQAAPTRSALDIEQAFRSSPAVPAPVLTYATPVGAISAVGAVGAVGTVSAVPATTSTAPPSDPTTASWGQTATRVLPRSNLPRNLAVGVVGLILLAAMLGIFIVLGSPVSDAGRESASAAPSEPRSAVVAAAPPAVTGGEPKPSSVTPVASAAPSPGGSSSAATPSPQETATAKAEPQGKVRKGEPSTKGKSAPASPAKPASSGKSILGGPPVF
jgi:serine/threonine protein kinase